MTEKEFMQILDETYEKFANTKYDSRFEIENKTYYTDTGYAIEGIEYFIQEVKNFIKTTDREFHN